MTITRRDVLLGATATAALVPLAARAQTSEVVIGVIYPFSGGSAQQGVDAQKAYETALEVINKDTDFDLLHNGTLYETSCLECAKRAVAEASPDGDKWRQGEISLPRPLGELPSDFQFVIVD